MSSTATSAPPPRHDAAPASTDLTGDPAMDAVLERLGATPGTLSAEQASTLSGSGYLLLPGHLPAPRLEALRAAHDQLMAQKYPSDAGCPAGGRFDWWHHEPGTRRLADLASEDPVFDGLYTDGLVLAAVATLLRHPFKLDSINAREALPGHGQQQLHVDAPRRDDGCEPGVNTAWLLDDFTSASGPTRVVPGSHRWPVGPETLGDACAPHPQERPILAPAGSVMVFANMLWHSGMRNLGSSGRRVVHVSYSRRERDLGARAQHLRIRKAVWERISPEARWILAV
jgi:hypothetical protein